MGPRFRGDDSVGMRVRMATYATVIVLRLDVVG
jgi:hypothetical protein